MGRGVDEVSCVGDLDRGRLLRCSVPTACTSVPAASMPSAAISVAAHLRSAVRSSRLRAHLLASASAALRSSGIAGPTATPRVLPISAPE